VIDKHIFRLIFAMFNVPNKQENPKLQKQEVGRSSRKRYCRQQNSIKMKKLLILLTSIFGIIACGNNQPQTNKQLKAGTKKSVTHNENELTCWSIAGCVGVVEDDHLGKLALGGIKNSVSFPPGQDTPITFEDMSVSIKRNSIPGKYIIRYPITSFDWPSWDIQDGCITFKIDYKLSDANRDTVTAHLKEWDKVSNSVKILATLQSNSTDIVGKYLSKEIRLYANGQHEHDMTPWNRVYYCEVILGTKITNQTLPPALPQTLFKIIGPSLGSIELCSTSCFVD
jgi:hypothetical protein